jgi:hypothetical protein
MITRLSETDITDQALDCGIARKALKHYNRCMPWGAKKRKASDYRYILYVSSRGRTTLWMRESAAHHDSVMYFSLNEQIGALTSTDAGKTSITLLGEEEIECLYEAQQQLLMRRLERQKAH